MPPEKGTLPFACSVASALATARGRYHLFPGGGRGVARLDERPGFGIAFLALAENPAEGGAAAFGGRGRPAGLPPACQTKERARGPWPRVRSFRALRAPPPPPHVSAPTFLLPLGNRRMTDGHALARGSRLPLGARRGGGWATPTRPLPGDAWQRVRSGAEPRCAAAPAGKAGREARAFCRPWNGGCRARA